MGATRAAGTGYLSEAPSCCLSFDLWLLIITLVCLLDMLHVQVLLE
jgi:hypothetical protein